MWLSIVLISASCERGKEPPHLGKGGEFIAYPRDHQLLHTSRYIYYYGSTALFWALTAFSVSWSCKQSVGFLGRGISPSQGLYLHTEQHKHRVNAHNTDYALSGIRTHDPSVRASEDSSYLRPRGHCDRHRPCIQIKNITSYKLKRILKRFRASLYQGCHVRFILTPSFCSKLFVCSEQSSVGTLCTQ
jgi:hypothetical protein